MAVHSAECHICLFVILINSVAPTRPLSSFVSNVLLNNMVMMISSSKPVYNNIFRLKMSISTTKKQVRLLGFYLWANIKKYLTNKLKSLFMKRQFGTVKYFQGKQVAYPYTSGNLWASLLLLY
jgi:hypothetical protein